MPSARMGNPEDADHSLVVIKIDDHTFADAKQSGSQFLILLGMIPRARSYQTPSPLLSLIAAFLSSLLGALFLPLPVLLPALLHLY